MDGQALAAILMTELTGARLVGGHRRRRRARTGAEDDPAARRADRAAARHRDPARRGGRHPAPARVRGRRGGRRARRHGAGLPARRRHARGRPVEEVARLWGLDKLPYTLPSRRGATGVLAPEQRLRRRAEDALAGAGLSEVCGWVFAAPDLVDRLRIPADDCAHATWSRCATRCPRTCRSCARRCSARCSTSRGATARGGWATCGCSRSARSSSPSRAPASGPPPRSAASRCRRRATHVGALLSGAMRPPSWREGEPPRGRLLRGQGRAGGAARHAARAVERRARRASRSCTRGARARVLVGGRNAGWLGEIHPAVARAWDLDDAARLRARPRRDRARGAATCRATRT